MRRRAGSPYTRVVPLIYTRSLTFAAFALAFAACSTPARRLRMHASELAEARTVAQAFYAAYGEQVGLPDAPFVTLGVESGPGYAYEPDHNVLFVTPYRDADFDTQRHFARACRDRRADAVYNEVIFRFFTAHELMHLAYDRLPMRDDLSEYERETRINVLTWLFLRESELMPANVAEVEEALAALQADLASRFPTIRDGEETAATLHMDDNASYWYVTAASMREAAALAREASTPAAYATRLARADRAGLAPAEAKM